MILASPTLCDHVVGNPATRYVQEHCPRCRGKGVYHAFNILVTGQVEKLSGFAALSQNITKILTEEMRTTGYGFDYSVFHQGEATGDLSSGIRGEVYRAMEYLMMLQATARTQGFRYLPTEEIDSIDDVKVMRHSVDPRQYFVTIYLTTTSGLAGQVRTLLTR